MPLRGACHWEQITFFRTYFLFGCHLKIKNILLYTMFYFTRITLVKSLKVYFLVTIQRIIIIDYTAYSGAYSGGGRLGARPSLSDSGGGGDRNLRERALSLTTAIETETKRKKKKKYIVSGVMMAKENSSSLLAISFYPLFSLFL